MKLDRAKMIAAVIGGGILGYAFDGWHGVHLGALTGFCLAVFMDGEW